MSLLRQHLPTAIYVVCCAIVLATVSGCCCCGPCSTSFTAPPPSVFDDLSEDSAETVDPGATAASVVNQYFPQDVSGYEIVMTGEKQGTSQADVKVDGNQVATLAIFDTSSNEDARTKYENAAAELQGFPLVHQGNKSMVLVGDRFQVTVQAKGDGGEFEDEKTRENWLKKFDLGGLSGAE